MSNLICEGLKTRAELDREEPACDCPVKGPGHAGDCYIWRPGRQPEDSWPYCACDCHRPADRAPSPGLAWPAWTPEPLLGELRDAEQMALGAVDVGRARCDSALVAAGEALAGELLALHVALTVPTVATLAGSLRAVHGLVGSLRAALRGAA